MKQFFKDLFKEITEFFVTVDPSDDEKKPIFEKKIEGEWIDPNDIYDTNQQKPSKMKAIDRESFGQQEFKSALILKCKGWKKDGKNGCTNGTDKIKFNKEGCFINNIKILSKYVTMQHFIKICSRLGIAMEPKG